MWKLFHTHGEEVETLTMFASHALPHSLEFPHSPTKPTKVKIDVTPCVI